MATPDAGAVVLRRLVTFKDRHVELEEGDTLIGRGERCRIQLIDPLVSRHHARIVCGARAATIEDLESRNGTRLNGKIVERPRPLRHGDRIKVGPYELVYTEMNSRPSAIRRAVPDDDADESEYPLWGSVTDVAWRGPVDRTNTGRWPIEMLVELLGRSILAQRERDVEGLMKQAMVTVDRMLKKATNSVDATHLQALWEAAVWLTKGQQNSDWITWAESAYRRANLPEPPPRPPSSSA